MLDSEGHLTVPMATKLNKVDITVEHRESSFNIALNNFVSL